MEKTKKKRRKKAEVEIQTLFKPVITQQALAAGTDPKSVLCMYFKQGSCTKGAKCKFSHDLAIERKAEKRSLYDDVRENSNKENETMANWDEAQLAEVVERRHGEDNRKKKMLHKLYANISLKLSRIIHTVGFGLVKTVQFVNIDMLYHLVSC